MSSVCVVSGVFAVRTADAAWDSRSPWTTSDTRLVRFSKRRIPPLRCYCCAGARVRVCATPSTRNNPHISHTCLTSDLLQTRPASSFFWTRDMLLDQWHHDFGLMMRCFQKSDIMLSDQRHNAFRSVTSCFQWHHAFRPATSCCQTSDIMLSDQRHHAFRPATSCFQTSDHCDIMLRPVTSCFQTSDIVHLDQWHHAFRPATSCFQTSDIMLSDQRHHAFRPATSCFQTSDIMLSDQRYCAFRPVTSCFQTSDIMLSDQRHHAFRPDQWHHAFRPGTSFFQRHHAFRPATSCFQRHHAFRPGTSCFQRHHAFRPATSCFQWHHAFRPATSCFQWHHAFRPGTSFFQWHHAFRPATSCFQRHHAFRPVTSCFQTRDIMLSDQGHHAFRPGTSCFQTRDIMLSATSCWPGTSFFQGHHAFSDIMLSDQGHYAVTERCDATIVMHQIYHGNQTEWNGMSPQPLSHCERDTLVVFDLTQIISQLVWEGVCFIDTQWLCLTPSGSRWRRVYLCEVEQGRGGVVRVGGRSMRGWRWTFTSLWKRCVQWTSSTPALPPRSSSWQIRHKLSFVSFCETHKQV